MAGQATGSPNANNAQLVGQNKEFDSTVRNLIDDKYCKEYKLDRDTRAMAIEILFCYYNKNQAEANVSSQPGNLSITVHFLSLAVNDTVVTHTLFFLCR